MLSFENDYSCAATPEIIARLAETATNQYPGYGTDDVCESAKAKIREACACPDAEIFFLVGGTSDQPGRHRRHHPTVCGRGGGHHRTCERA